MKTILTVFFLVVCSVSFAKNLESYTASNGITYQKGDTITLGIGSAPNGTFNYLQMGGLGNSLAIMAGDMSSINSNAGRHYSGTIVVLKRIFTGTGKAAKKVAFVVGGGNITNYYLMIEEAIATCEIRDCKKPQEEKPVTIQAPAPDKYDQLAKLKGLLDDGVVTQAEFEAEKARLLGMEAIDTLSTIVVDSAKADSTAVAQ